MDAIRICRECLTIKPLAEFAKDGRKYRRRCLPCYNEVRRPSNRAFNRRRRSNPEYLEKQRVWGRNWGRSEKGHKTRNEHQRKARQNPVRAFSDRLSRLLRDALNSRGLKKAGRTRELLGYTPEALFKHLRRFIGKPCKWCGTEIYNWRNTAVDHKTPLCTAKTKEDILRLNKLTNLRLIHYVCNSEKGSRLLTKAPKSK